MTQADVNAGGDLLQELLEENAIDDRAEIVALLPSLHLQREVMGEARKEDKRLTERVKQWLLLARETEVEDGEHGIRAWLQERSGSPDYDVISAANASPEMVVKLAQAGVLKVDRTALSAMRGKAAHFDDFAARYAMPGQMSVALRVERRGP